MIFNSHGCWNEAHIVITLFHIIAVYNHITQTVCNSQNEWSSYTHKKTLSVQYLITNY